MQDFSLNKFFPQLKEAIAAGLEAYKPVIAAEFVRYTAVWMDEAVEKFGPAMEGMYSVAGYYKMWATTIRPMCETYKIDETKSNYARNNTGYRINAERQQHASEIYADAVVLDCVAKIVAKIGCVETLEVACLEPDGTFVVRGVFKGKTITLYQSRILKTSTKGVLFNQWPALIYVDGKKFSEAQFKKMVAAA